MNRYWALFKVLLINNFGISAIQLKTRERAIYLKKLGLGALIIAAIAPTLWLYTRILIQGYDLLSPLGQEGAILSLGTVLVSSIVFFFGIFYVLNYFYFAADAQNLLALPLSGWQVLGARFSLILAYEYISELPFLLPPLLIYGIKSGASPTYWLFAVVGLLLIPLLPLSLATIPTLVLMRFANLGRRKDLLKILGSLIIIALAVAYQFLFQNAGPDAMDPAFLQKMLSDSNGLMNMVSRVFPSSRYLGLALVNANDWAGFYNLLIFSGISLSAVGLTWLFGELFYFQGVVGSSETTARRKTLKSSDYTKLGRGWPPLLTYAIKEIRLLLRTPPYFINCVLTNLLVPVLLFIPFLIQSRNQKTPLPWEDLLSMPEGQVILIAVVTGLVMFLASSNAITATSLSREGKEFYVSKYIPLTYREQIEAKLLSGYLFGIIGEVLLIIAANFLLPLDFTLNVLLLCVSLAAMGPVIEAGLLIDIFRPKQNWSNEQQAVKQNLNVIFSMLFAVLLGGVILYTTIRFIHSLHWAAGFMLVCFVLITIVFYYLLITVGQERFRKLEG